METGKVSPIPGEKPDSTQIISGDFSPPELRENPDPAAFPGAPFPNYFQGEFPPSFLINLDNSEAKLPQYPAALQYLDFFSGEIPAGKGSEGISRREINDFNQNSLFFFCLIRE